jgi:hypothetical protein
MIDTAKVYDMRALSAVTDQRNLQLSAVVLLTCVLHAHAHYRYT